MSQNAGEYARLCYELGIEPEDQGLYDQGAQLGFDLSELEKVVEKSNDETIPPLKKRKRNVSDKTYMNFYDEGINLSTNLWRDTDTKIRLLEEYFPQKGDTSNMSPRQIGSKFNSMMTYAGKRIS